jgi:pyruvate-formate lyase
MAVTRTEAEEFQRLAEECRAMAQTLSTEQARAEMLAMADVCDRVATHHAPDVGSRAVVRIMTRSNSVG